MLRLSHLSFASNSMPIAAPRAWSCMSPVCSENLKFALAQGGLGVRIGQMYDSSWFRRDRVAVQGLGAWNSTVLNMI